MFSGEKSRETSWVVIIEIGRHIPLITGIHEKCQGGGFYFVVFFFTLAVKKANHFLFKGIFAELTRSNFDIV